MTFCKSLKNNCYRQNYFQQRKHSPSVRTF